MNISSADTNTDVSMENVWKQKKPMKYEGFFFVLIFSFFQ
jgi:hypothetical protein